MPLAAIRVNQAANIVSVIRLPDSGEEWTETTEFKPNGICYYGTRRWSPSASGRVMETRLQSHAMEPLERAALRPQTAC
jgi:hypothetical protein